MADDERELAWWRHFRSKFRRFPSIGTPLLGRELVLCRRLPDGTIEEWPPRG